MRTRISWSTAGLWLVLALCVVAVVVLAVTMDRQGVQWNGIIL